MHSYRADGSQEKGMIEEAVRCPHCYSDIDPRATVCPFCRRDVIPAAVPPAPPPQRARQGNKRVWLAVLFFVAVTASLAVCCSPLLAAIGWGLTPAGQAAMATSRATGETATAVAIAMRGETATARWNVILELTANAPTATPTPSKTPTGTPTRTPTATPTPSGSAVAIQNGNLRGGPGTHYPIVGTVQAGDTLAVFGRTAEGWLQVDGAGAKWVASSLVNLDVDTTAVAIAQAIPPTPTVTLPPTLTPSATPTKTPKPTVTAGPPTVQTGAFLPGLHPSDIKVNLQERNFECTNVEQGVLYYMWTCTREVASYQLIVYFYSRTLSTVDHIDAGALFFGVPDQNLAADFLGFIATMPYDNARPEEARQWVENNISLVHSQGGEGVWETFGGVQYHLGGIPTATTLEMGYLP